MSHGRTAAAIWHGPGAILGRPVVEASPIAQPWPSTTETTLATIAEGTRLVVQASTDALAIARRVEIARHLGEVAPWLPMPSLLATGVNAGWSWLATAFIAGESGRAMLGTAGSAAALGTLVGRLTTALAQVPAAGLSGPATWGSAASLADAARGWFGAVAGAIGEADARSLADLIDRVPAELEAPPVFVHGDLVPVNLIVRDGVLAGLVDLEDARIAHPLFDLAWFGWTLRRFHPDVAEDAIRAALAAATIAGDATARRLDLLATLRCLELLATAPSSDSLRAQLVGAIGMARMRTMSAP